ncbi:hypothetical protein FSP39_001367 [Pinctada imbricata]|uniref:Flavin-containing monooxygenase n=1 Tax=Pinctada imbricata TaxID=66713 RepID=A0AA88Y0X2_PINIB|nr:hypothetical protein FSP39_001367 [Pinctada imbricata]
MSSPKRVAVIGAGASGLTAIKCCLDEGLEPVCFERTDHIGEDSGYRHIYMAPCGLWYYTESAVDGQACVMKSTVINTSKEMMCYSDFPIPKEYPIFMHNSYVLKYFNLYCNNFGLKKYIQFKTEVVSLRKRPDFASSGQWDIQIRNRDSGEKQDLVFDAVMICTGHHAEKNMPTFPGLDKFKGKVIHSHDYKDSRGYEDKRIVVVGIGNSGGDAAVELSRVASQVYLSTRRGSWIINRVAENGYPIDMGLSKFLRSVIQRLPASLVGSLLISRLNHRFDHALYSLRPKHAPLSQHPTVNDDLPNRIISGGIIVKPDIKTFTENGVIFENGSKKEEIDVAFLATGYIFRFPFVDKSVIEVKQNKVNLYKWMFPPDLEKQTLCVIGCIQPLGAIMPISENQSRLFLRVIKGDVKLPTSQEMWDDIHFKSDAMAKRYVKSQRHTIQVDYVDYMDEIAEIGGNKPDLYALLKKDPKLALRCFFGACTPYQYRLMGPNSWAGAREAIMTQWDRTCYPLKTRPLGFEIEKSQLKFFLIYFLFIAVFAFIVHYLFMS